MNLTIYDHGARIKNIDESYLSSYMLIEMRKLRQ